MANLSTLSSQDFLKKASAVAAHYGFIALDSLEKGEPGPKRSDAEFPEISEAVRKDPFGNVAASLLAHCSAKNFMTIKRKEPTLIYYAAAPGKRAAGTATKQRSVKFGLAVLGCPKSIGEALIIKTSLAILEELGVQNSTVYVNSVGDRDSAARFGRELTNYLKRHIEELTPAMQQALKRDPFEALEALMESSIPLRDSLPRPLHFLSEVSRRHLREVLEFLELDGISYSIEDQLVGHRDCYTQTLFEIRHPHGEAGEHRTLVRGGRCDELARKNFRSNVPVVGAVFEHEPGKKMEAPPQKAKVRAPKFFLVQLGFSAKLLSLSVLESLRKAHIPVHQTINNDSLSEQLEAAKFTKTPYLLIMGQREVLDKTVIVRNAHSQAQEIVPLQILTDYLKTSLKI